jgi:FAM192A/Fyv6, N-terminal domain
LNETAAKQEAFEEANRLKNQFRALDQDEVDFLDSVLESTRKEEERVRRETAEGLEHFRKQQEEADKKGRIGDEQGTNEASSAVEEEQWVAGGRKRKRVKEKEGLKGVKIRKSSFAGETESTLSPSGKKQGNDPKSTAVAQEGNFEPKSKTTSTAPVSKSPPSASPKLKPGLSLVNYGSDEDDY